MALDDQPVDLRGVARGKVGGDAEPLLDRGDLGGVGDLDRIAGGFGPGLGVTGVVLLAESHISIHTWPENGFAAADIFMCGAAQPRSWK